MLGRHTDSVSGLATERLPALALSPLPQVSVMTVNNEIGIVEAH